MKVTRVGESSFVLEMEASDAEEKAVEHALWRIGVMLEDIKKHGYSQDIRMKDRAGYWRYSEVERGLGIIRSAADEALRHIRFLDFPEDRLEGGIQ